MRSRLAGLARVLRWSVLLVAFLAAAPSVSLAQFPGWCGNPVPPPDPPPPPPPPPPCQPDDECKKCTGSPCYVATGAYVMNAVDLAIGTNGFPLMVSRNYRSTQAIDGPMGVGWIPSVISRLYHAVYLYSAPSTYQKQAYVIMPDGSRLTYVDNGNGTFSPPLGRHDTLVQNGDLTFDLTLQRTRSKLHFGSTGALLSMTDDYGNALNLTYDGNGRIQQVADASGSGRYLNVFWGADGRISSIQDSFTRQVRYTYNAQGALATTTDAANRVTTYAYAAGRFAPLLTRITDNWTRVVTDITYEASDRVKTYTDKGETYTYTYAYQGNATTTAKADSSGNTYIYPFSAAGYVTDSTPPSGGGGATHSDYYPDGSVQLHRDGVGVQTFYTYTADGSPLTVTRDYQGPDAVRFDYLYDPNFPTKTTSITPKNPTTNAVDLDWQAWRYDYYQTGAPAPGALFHVYRVRDDGVTLDTLATYVYDSRGRVTRHTSATGGVTDYGYDVAGNLTTVTAPANNDGGTRPVTTNGYDSLGRVTSVTDPLNHATAYTYDGLDRVKTVTLPKPTPGSTLTFTTSYAYDVYDAPSGLLFTQVTDPNGKVTKQGYDQFGQMARTTDALTRNTSYSFARGLLNSITDANGNVTNYGYDAARRLTSTSFPDSVVERYSYTADNLLYQRTDRKNQTITHAYDRLKRLGQKSYSGGTSITSTYEGQKLSQIVDTSVSPTETHIFGYDISYRLESVTQASRGTASYQYDAADRVANGSVQGGPSTTYTYYPDGSSNTIAWTPVAGQFKYTYTLAGQYDLLTLPNGQKRDFSYDDQGRLTQLVNSTSAAANLATYAYGYDLNHATGVNDRKGQRVSLTATVPGQGLANHLFKYEYDSLYQLTKATYPNVAPFLGEVDSWTYDGIGNRLTNTVNATTQTYTYQKIGANPLNWQRLVNDGVNAYTYDANGNTQTRAGTALTWTPEDRLAGVTGTSGYVYDHTGRRSSKTVAAATTSYLYDGLNLVQEAGATSADYLFGPGIDEPLAMSRGGQTYYYVTDGLGSVNAVTNSSATVQNTYLYDAWGQTRSQTGSLANPFTYTARELGEAGTLFYRARSYQSSTGRFLSEDPVQFLDTQNLYPYVFNNPLYWVDPDGHQPRTPGQGGPPNGRIWLPAPDGHGGIWREFGPDGRAARDYHWGQDHGQGDPHTHDWDWSKPNPREPGRPPKPGEPMPRPPSPKPLPPVPAWWQRICPIPPVINPCFYYGQHFEGCGGPLSSHGA